MPTARPLPHLLSSPLIRRAAGSWLLAVWFAVLSAGSLLQLGPNAAGVDAKIYYRASAAWLAGENPWNASAGFDGNIYHYAGFPTTTIAFAPFTFFPEDGFVAMWLALTWIAAILVIRHLGLPWWWLLFPPLTEALLSGNPSIVLLALLLLSNTLGRAIAPLLKLYAAVPLIAQGRVRPLAITAIAGVAMIVIAPQLWLDFVRLAPVITSRLLAESAGGYSAAPWPLLWLLAAAALAALALIDIRAAGWLAVPALWPAAEFHYATLALPVMTPWLGYLLALPIRGLPAVAVIAYCVVRIWRRRQSGAGFEIDSLPLVVSIRAWLASTRAPRRSHPDSRPID
jgi:hypothetical protein